MFLLVPPRLERQRCGRLEQTTSRVAVTSPAWVCSLSLCLTRGLKRLLSWGWRHKGARSGAVHCCGARDCSARAKPSCASMTKVVSLRAGTACPEKDPFGAVWISPGLPFALHQGRQGQRNLAEHVQVPQHQRLAHFALHHTHTGQNCWAFTMALMELCSSSLMSAAMQSSRIFTAWVMRYMGGCILFHCSLEGKLMHPRILSQSCRILTRKASSRSSSSPSWAGGGSWLLVLTCRTEDMCQAEPPELGMGLPSPAEKPAPVTGA